MQMQAKYGGECALLRWSGAYYCRGGGAGEVQGVAVFMQELFRGKFRGQSRSQSRGLLPFLGGLVPYTSIVEQSPTPAIGHLQIL